MFLSKTVAYIPTPIYFGAVIDTTCMLWQQECGVQGSCWEYNVTSFRFVYFGLAAGLKFVGFIFIFLAWYSIKSKEGELQRQRHRDLPLSTVSQVVGRPDKTEKYNRTRSCPAFSTQGEFHEESGQQKGIPYTAQTYSGPFPEAISSSVDPGLEESPDAI
jgi:organic anion transporter 5A